MASTKWSEIWNNRLIKPVENLPIEQVLSNLLAMDGFDSVTGSIGTEEWLQYLDHLGNVLNVDKNDSIFEVGCGSGAFLYPFYLLGNNVSGLDYSGDLISTAKKAMPDMDFETNEAVFMNISPTYDHLVASSVQCKNTR